MKLTIIGASGHGKVIADIAQKVGYDEVEFLDDNASLSGCAGYPVVGKSKEAFSIENDLFFAIGDAKIRRNLTGKCQGKQIPVLIHPSAVIAEDVFIGAGSVVMAGAVINPGTILGQSCIINTCSSVDHDCIVGDFVHVAVGAHLCGHVTVGDDTWIGAGATVSNNIMVCGNSMIGAGAVVVKNLEEAGTYVGVPAKIIK